MRSARRANKPTEIATMDDIERMPALVGVRELASITGLTETSVAKQCRSGMFSEFSVKCGREWRVNKSKALAALGLG